MALLCFGPQPAAANAQLVIVFPLYATRETESVAPAFTRAVAARIAAVDGYAALVEREPGTSHLAAFSGAKGGAYYVTGRITKVSDRYEIEVAAHKVASDAVVGDQTFTATDPTGLPSTFDAPLLLQGPAPSTKTLVFAPPPGTNTIYILATGNDTSGVKGRLAAKFRRILEENYNVPSTLWFVPAPDLSLQDFADLCKSRDAAVTGAVVLNLLAVTSGNDSHFVYRKGWTSLDVTGSYLKCDSGGNPLGDKHVSYSDWRTRVFEQRGSVTTVTPLPAVGLALEVASGVMAFVPSKTRESDAVRTFPTPSPALPATPFTSSITTKDTSVSNVGAAFAPIAGALLTQGLAYTSSVTGLANGDAQSDAAVEDIVNHLIVELHCDVPALKPPAEEHGPQAPRADICNSISLNSNGPLAKNGWLSPRRRGPLWSL